MIEIANVFGHGFDSASMASLEGLGFAIRPGTSHFAGAQAMRFIDFERGPSLELIEVTDPKAYAAFVPEGMAPYCPGINLLVRGEAESRLVAFAEAFAELRPYRLHVNYDGSSEAGKPGWNYLNFGIPVLQDTFVWLTTLDEPHPSPAKVTAHPNGAAEVRGLWLDVQADALEPLSRLVGGDVRDGALDVGGVKLWSRESKLEVSEVSAKRFPLALVVLETNKLQKREEGAEGIEKTLFNSQPATHVRTNPLSWDLVLVERRKVPSHRSARPRPREAYKVSRPFPRRR